MSRPNVLVTAALFALLVSGCDDQGPKHGVRSECAAFGGAGLECEHVAIESAADACWKLVDCGAIPLENPVDNPDCCFDWQFCIRELERTDDLNRDLIFGCVESSSCDDLKTDRSPNGPGRSEDNLPLCLQHGNF